MTENLDVFFIDLGVVVAWGAQNSLQGLYSAPGELIANGQVISEEHSVLMKTSDVQDGWKTNDQITVDGTAFYIRTVKPIEDGKFSVVSMSKQ